MNFNKRHSLALVVLGGIAAVAMSACGNSSTSANPSGYIQIERLGRPAINEGLVRSNAYLNAFNAIGPSSDLSTAAAPVVAEAAGTLGVLRSLATGHASAGPAVTTTAGQFLPDVMRVDTTDAVPVIGTPAYSSCLSTTAKIPCGGRKLQDDVMSFTYSYLVLGDPAYTAGSPGHYHVGDGVTYAGSGTCQGHQKLNGAASTAMVAATFPYLAPPN